jgi:hypothetical protein
MKKARVMLTRVDVYIADRVEYIANNSKDLELTKSEIVRIILHAFFKSQKDNTGLKQKYEWKYRV